MSDDQLTTWDAIARQEPYFAVLTHDRFLSRNMDAAAAAEFYATGEAWVEHVLATALRVAPALTPQSVLEFGCGPGRLAIPFAQRVANVVAADVSSAMLQLTAAAAAEAGLGNVRTIGAESVLDSTEQFDLLSVHRLLQHLEPAEGLALLRRLLDRVAEGGVAVLHVPYRLNAGTLSTIARRLRVAVPPLNRVANAVRNRPATIPLFTPHVYDLTAVAAILTEAGFEEPRVEFVREGELEIAQMFVRRNVRHTEPAAPAAEAPPVPQELIDVKELIANASIDQLNATAESYFSSLVDWEHQLSKPYSSIEDAAHILTHVGPLLAGLRLAPGDTVLEFGAGTGWLSHALTQLGCRAILLDVSPSALRIARELYARHPIIGERPAPEFLVYDGRRIDLSDASVDRVICFDAFHHVPNPAEVIAEMGRVLRPGGIAGFNEPGPEHSKTAQSQFEMRTYGVIENDVDIREIWRAARAAGFARIELAAVSGTPLLLSLGEFEDLLGRGAVMTGWIESLRNHLANVRMFFLHREGEERVDSRRRSGLAASIEARALQPPRPGEGAAIEATITNTGTSPWLPGSVTPGGVAVGVHAFSASGEILDFEFHREPIPRALEPEDSVTLTFTTRPLPERAARLDLDCVAEGVTWFALIGGTRVSIPVESAPAHPNEE